MQRLGRRGWASGLPARQGDLPAQTRDDYCVSTFTCERVRASSGARGGPDAHRRWLGHSPEAALARITLTALQAARRPNRRPKPRSTPARSLRMNGHPTGCQCAALRWFMRYEPVPFGTAVHSGLIMLKECFTRTHDIVDGPVQIGRHEGRNTVDVGVELVDRPGPDQDRGDERSMAEPS